MNVQLGLTPDAGWEIGVDDLVLLARKVGFSSLGILADRVDPAAARAYQQARMGCHELLALLVSDDEAATLSQSEQLAQTAAVIGAPWVLTVFLTYPDPKLINRCAATLADAGTRMAVEFTPLGPVTSISAGLEVVSAAGKDRAGLLLDSWHFCRLDSTWEDLERVPLEQIAYVQFDDALPLVGDDLVHETINRRTMPGEGELELNRFASTLLDRGWDGLVSVEVLSEDLRSAPVDAVVQRAYDSSVPYWS
jgi:sugar phosphate isomerase/epimerase